MRTKASRQQMKSETARAWFSPAYLCLAIDEVFGPPLSTHHSDMNLQRRFAVRSNLAFDVTVSLTMARALQVGEPARAGRGLYSAQAAENGAPETYFNEVLIAVNLVLSLEPSPFTAVRIAREMPAAIRPYSMTVAAVSSFKNLEIIFTASVPSRYSVQ